MEKQRLIYAILILLVWAELINLMLRLINPYYTNLVLLSLITVIVSWFGLMIGVRRWVVVTFGGLAILLSVLMLFFVWNR